jgi:hypothetical protein
MEYTPPPKRAIESYLSERGSASVIELSIYGNTTEIIAESIVRDLVFQGKVRYLRDEQDGGARVAIWTDS